MPNDPTTYYFTQGVLGVTVIVLALVCVKLYNRSQQLQDERLTDAKDTTEKVVTALQNNTQSNLILAEKIEAGKRVGV
jgi:hypothetical protein